MGNGFGHVLDPAAGQVKEHADLMYAFKFNIDFLYQYNNSIDVVLFEQTKHNWDRVGGTIAEFV